MQGKKDSCRKNGLTVVGGGHLVMEHQAIGRVTHYYSKIGVALILLEDDLEVGENIAVIGSTTEIDQKVDSMQVNHEMIDFARSGDLVGLKVKGRVREGDTVYKLG